MTNMLKITNLHVYFQTDSGTVRANNGVNLEVTTGKATGIMGESGCGKTVLFLSILRLQQPGRIISGSIEFDGKDIVTMPEKAIRCIRGRQIGLIPQNQATALNPAYTVGQHLSEIIRIRAGKTDLWSNITPNSGLWRENQDEVENLLKELGLGDISQIRRLLKNYPHQLSGGIRQRVLIAMALLLHPGLIIADEPTTALDRVTRVQSLELLQQLHGKTTLLIISHDIQTIQNTCEYVAIMYGGRIIESGPVQEVLCSPQHPYTRLLLSCQQRRRGEPLTATETETLDLINFPAGCSFHPGCSLRLPICSQIQPDDYFSGSVKVSCHLFNREAVAC